MSNNTLVIVYQVKAGCRVTRFFRGPEATPKIIQSYGFSIAVARDYLSLGQSAAKCKIARNALAARGAPD